ncbi:MAG: TonB family protein [Erythrobacter sp.]
MPYAAVNRRPNAAALAGAIGIPGGIGALLVVGLAVTVVAVPKPPNLKGEMITQTTLPPPPPPTPDKPQPDTKAATTSTPIPIPIPPVGPMPVDLGMGDPVTALPGIGDPAGTGSGDLIIPTPLPSASPYTPVGAKPKGNPGKWVTNDDYRSRWIMEEMAGTARFSLGIDARGQVTGCTITRSTGHAPLDAATCALVSKRGRFDAARDSTGKPVAGSYTGSVTWRIPE